MKCRWELKWHKFGLTHHRPAHFGTAQWQDPERVSLLFLLYRLVMFAYFWGFFIYDLVESYTPVSRAYYMIYLTNWSYLTALLDLAVQLVSATLAAVRSRRGVKPLVPGWLYKTHWVIVNISHTIEPLVTAMYWAGVYPFLGIPVTYADLHLHLLTTLYTMLDLMVHATPRRFHHVIFPLAFGIAYLTFTLVYYACGGVDKGGNTAIYPILDWAEPGMSAGVSVAACAVVFVMHALSWAAVRLRLRWHAGWRRRAVGAAAADVTGSGGNDVIGSELRVDVDTGKGSAATAADGRPVDMQKAFDNAALELDSYDDAGHRDNRTDSSHKV